MNESVKVKKFEIYELNTEVPLEKIKSEVFLDDDKFGFNVAQLHESVDIKSEESENLKSTHDVIIDSYTTYRKCFLAKHMNTHSNEKNIYSCKNCSYKTYLRKLLAIHITLHAESTKTSTSRFKNCMRCSASFTSKQMLDDHLLRTHPELIASVTSKIHECAMCVYKTTIKTGFHRHIMSFHRNIKSKSPKPARSKIIHCKHCNAVYKSKQIKDDHVLKNHPEFIATVTSKIHECGMCSYKTTVKPELNKHLLKHPELGSGYKYKLSTCLHCKKNFTSKVTYGRPYNKKTP
nr:unnamed protein product [Callosobruchus analis]